MIVEDPLQFLIEALSWIPEGRGFQGRLHRHVTRPQQLRDLVHNYCPVSTASKDGRVVQTDSYGKRYDKPQYKVEGDKVYETDKYGSVRQQRKTTTDEII